MLSNQKVLPRIVNRSLIQREEEAETSTNLPVPVADIICFDTVSQPKDQARVLAWVSFSRQPNNRAESLHFHLPQKVTAKFVSVVFIQSENFLALYDDTDHQTANVDVESITFCGKKIQVPQELLLLH